MSITPTTPDDPEYRVIIFEDVAIAFDNLVVLDGVSFVLHKGETKILLGVAGSGKSLLLKLALGLLKPDRGRIWVLGQDVTEMREEELFDLRRRLGMVFQESALFDSLTVRENVSFRLREEHVPDDEIERRVREALRFVELEHTVDLFPAELSGGMRRRVAIARAIINEPAVLLYDSPTGGLDPVTSTTIIELIVKQRDEMHTSSLMVTHRLQDAFIMASHYYDSNAHEMRPLRGTQGERQVNLETTFVLLKDGKIIFDGTAPALAASGDEYIREYIA